MIASEDQVSLDSRALVPNFGSEDEFHRDNNPFAFSPGQINKLLNPKSLGAFQALGGLAGLEKGLSSDIESSDSASITRQSTSRHHSCTVCGIVRTTSEALEQHARTAFHRTLVCPEPDCNRSFYRRDVYIRHRSVHKEAHGYACKWCAISGKSTVFERKDHLNQHIRIRHMEPHRPTSDTLYTGYEPSVSATIGDVSVSCLPDTGARASCIGLPFLRRLGIEQNVRPCDASATRRTADGREVKPLGTVNLPIQFANEKKTWHEDFLVLGRCAQDVILGSPFLRLTETLTRFSRRIVRTLRSAGKHMVHFSSGSERVVGALDGLLVPDAVPDYGSDIMLMSADYARQRRYVIDTDRYYHEELEFVDGFRAWTSGIVKDVKWSFGSSGDNKRRCDFYVLEDLQCDVLLSYDFLYETDAFAKYDACMYQKTASEGHAETGNDCVLGVIIQLKKRLEQETLTTQELGHRREDLLQRRDDFVHRIGHGNHTLTLEQKAIHKTSIAAWKQDWDRLIEDHQRKERELMKVKNEAIETILREHRARRLTVEQAEQARGDYEAMWSHGWRALIAVRPNPREPSIRVR